MDAVNESSTVIDDGLSIISSSTTQSPSPDDERSGALLWHISDHTTENGIDNRTPLPVQIIVSSPTKDVLKARLKIAKDYAEGVHERNEELRKEKSQFQDEIAQLKDEIAQLRHQIYLRDTGEGSVNPKESFDAKLDGISEILASPSSGSEGSPKKSAGENLGHAITSLNETIKTFEGQNETSLETLEGQKLVNAVYDELNNHVEQGVHDAVKESVEQLAGNTTKVLEFTVGMLKICEKLVSRPDNSKQGSTTE